MSSHLNKIHLSKLHWKHTVLILQAVAKITFCPWKYTVCHKLLCRANAAAASAAFCKMLFLEWRLWDIYNELNCARAPSCYPAHSLCNLETNLNGSPNYLNIFACMYATRGGGGVTWAKINSHLNSFKPLARSLAPVEQQHFVLLKQEAKSGAGN